MYVDFAQNTELFAILFGVFFLKVAQDHLQVHFSLGANYVIRR